MRVLSLTLALLVLLQLLLTAAILAMGVPPAADSDGTSTITRAAAAIELLAGLSPEQRALAITALDSPGLDLRLHPAHASVPESRLPPSAPLARRFAEHLGGIPFSVHIPPGAPGPPLEFVPPAAHPPFHLVARAPDGQTITLHARAGEARSLVIRGASSLSALLSTVILILVLFAAALRGRPIHHMAARARRLAEDPEAPFPVAPGSDSMRDLAQALDRIQGTLRGLVAERTFILASIAHDMRTHLSRLRMRIDGLGEDANRERMIGDIANMDRLIGDTLFYARADHRHEGPEEFCLADLVRDVLRGHRELGEAVSGVIPHPLRDRLIRSHPEAIARALSNLIDNAVRYAGSAEVVLNEEAGHLRLDVLDEGPGVPEEALSRIAAPYQRVEASRSRATGGTGLGLAIVASLARTAGAKLELANRPGGGFRATLHLPNRPD